MTETVLGMLLEPLSRSYELVFVPYSVATVLDLPRPAEMRALKPSAAELRGAYKFLVAPSTFFLSSEDFFVRKSLIS